LTVTPIAKNVRQIPISVPHSGRALTRASDISQVLHNSCQTMGLDANGEASDSARIDRDR
jgi:hypothetical protein